MKNHKMSQPHQVYKRYYLDSRHLITKLLPHMQVLVTDSMLYAGASILWGNEAEIFIIVILGGKKAMGDEIFVVHDTLVQFRSLPRLETAKIGGKYRNWAKRVRNRGVCRNFAKTGWKLEILQKQVEIKKNFWSMTKKVIRNFCE